MGKRGPAPAPTQLRMIRGDKKSRINRAEPKPAEQAVVRPRTLSAAARAVWDRIAPDLIDKQVLTFWDVDLFARYCEQAVVAAKAQAVVNRRGVLVKGDKGRLVKNPALQVARDATKEMLSIGARFGLTPSDRGQLRIGDGGGKQGEDLLT